jgi:hypothetical protein
MMQIDLDVELRTALLAQLARYGVDDATEVVQANQPTSQGAPSGPAILFAKLFDGMVGWPQRKDVYNAETGLFDHVESQQVATTYQFSALARVASDDLTSPSAADLLGAAGAALRSDTMMAALRGKGVGVLRVGEIRNTPVQNEQGEYESNPSFDVVLTHRVAYVETVPALAAREVNIQRI